MALFPFNNNKLFYGSQGAPLNYTQALKLAEVIYDWHITKGTDSWTSDAPTKEAFVENIALGLITISADPSIVRILNAIGAQAKFSIVTLTSLISSKETVPTEVRGVFRQLSRLGFPGFQEKEDLTDGEPSDTKRDST